MRRWAGCRPRLPGHPTYPTYPARISPRAAPASDRSPRRAARVRGTPAPPRPPAPIAPRRRSADRSARRRTAARATTRVIISAPREAAARARCVTGVSPWPHDHPHHARSRRAERHPHADLRRPLVHRERHDAGDAGRGDDRARRRQTASRASRSAAAAPASGCASPSSVRMRLTGCRASTSWTTVRDAARERCRIGRRCAPAASRSAGGLREGAVDLVGRLLVEAVVARVVDQADDGHPGAAVVERDAASDRIGVREISAAPSTG